LTRERSLDADFTAATLMGTIDVEGSSIAGGRIPGIAASAEIQRIREKRKRDDLHIILQIARLRETLAAIDKRIARLSNEIADLEIERSDAETKSEAAFWPPPEELAHLK